MNLSDTGFELKIEGSRKRQFLDAMRLVEPWIELFAVIASHAPAPGAPKAEVQRLLFKRCFASTSCM